MPAGEYQVVRDTGDSALRIQALDQQHIALAIPSLSYAVPAGSPPEFKLVFHRYMNGTGTRSFLKAGQSGWNRIELMATRAEREAEAAVHIAKGTRTEVVILAKNLR
jgi:hypothetical protein